MTLPSKKKKKKKDCGKRLLLGDDLQPGSAGISLVELVERGSA